MTLISFEFILFCSISLIVFFIVPKKLQWLVILLSSIFFIFYDNFTIGTLIQLILVLLTSYFCGILIDKYTGTKKSIFFLFLGICVLLGQLLYLKYTNFIFTSINHIFNIFNINFTFELVYRNSLIGISYYTLIMISYLVDIYRGACKPQNNILKCALFMSYFPILTSGPFIRYKDIENDLYGKHKFNFHNLCYGLLRIIWGAFKVLVISERLSYFVNTVYGNIHTYQGFYTIIAALFFTLQLYTNFSGSIDIIMGISEILGINLPENFNAPFFSKTITEFWRKWHITLGGWLRDYIFYPLQKSRLMQSLNKKCKKKFGKKFGKKVTLYISMLIMWIIIGIWHGGEYKYIIGSGLLQFLFIFLEDILAPIGSKLNKKIGINTEAFSYKLYQIIRTYLLFSFSMIFFRASNVSNALEIIKNMFIWNPWILLDNTSLFNAGLDIYDFRVLIISLIVLFIVEYFIHKGNIRERFFKQNLVFKWVVVYLLMFSIIIFGCYGVGYDSATFIYRQF